MKNTFSPIELQVILNMIGDGYTSNVEAQMLREKIERLAAKPVSLRELAKNYIIGLLDGTEDEPNAVRLEAAKLAIERYWFSEDEEDYPENQMGVRESNRTEPDRTYSVKVTELRTANGAESLPAPYTDQMTENYSNRTMHPEACPRCGGEWLHYDMCYSCVARFLLHPFHEGTETQEYKLGFPMTPPSNADSSYGQKQDDCESNPAPWTGDDIPASARIKDLDCSTPDPGPAVKISNLQPDGAYPVASGPVRQYPIKINSDESPKDWVENLTAGIANGQRYAEQQRHEFFGAPYLTKGKQPFHAPVLTEHGKTPPDWYARNHTPNPGAGGGAPTLESGTGGPVADKIPNFIEQIRSERFPRPAEPMTVERAVTVLNEHKYQGFDNWHLRNSETIGMGAYKDGVMVYGVSHYEGIAVAEKLEREK